MKGVGGYQGVTFSFSKLFSFFKAIIYLNNGPKNSENHFVP